MWVKFGVVALAVIFGFLSLQEIIHSSKRSATIAHLNEENDQLAADDLYVCIDMYMLLFLELMDLRTQLYPGPNESLITPLREMHAGAVMLKWPGLAGVARP